MAYPNDGNVNDFLVTESGRIQSQLDEQCRVESDVWNSLIMRNPFPLNMGQQLTKIVYERSGTDSAFLWNTLTINPLPGSGGTGNNANPAAVTINPAWNSWTFSLGYGAIDSNPLSIHDANLGLNFPDQLSATVGNLEGNVKDIWFDRKQDQFDYWCGHKVIAQLGVGTLPPESGATVPWLPVAANSQLTVELCWYNRDRTMRDGGKKGLDTVQGKSTPIMIVDPTVWRQILYSQNSHREDVRYSNDADVNVNPLGIKGEMFDFMWALNYKAPRYNFVGNQYVRVPFYENDAAVIGSAQEPSVAYLNAQYVVSYMFHPQVFELLVYDPEPSFNNGVSFESSTWMGKFKWINEYDRQFNQDKMTGYFRALLGSAPRPILPNLGYAVMSRLCPHDFPSSIGCMSS